MKLSLLLLIMTLGLHLPGLAQSIPEGATGIEVRTSLTDSTLFSTVQGFLETQEFVIEEADEATFTLTTERKRATAAVQMRVLVIVANSIAHFTAEGITEPDETLPDEPFAYDDEDKAGFITLNRLVDQFAKAFDLATIEYVVP